ncbi:MAG: sigma-70 family RNA polymerase sigma factor [Nannocystaceae bacterium]
MSKAKHRDDSPPEGGPEDGSSVRRRESRNVVLEADIVQVDVEDADAEQERSHRAEDSAIIEAEVVAAELVEGDVAGAGDAALASPGQQLLEEDEVDPLADIGPVSDADLDAIAREVLAGRSAPEGTAALAVRDPMGAYMAEVRRYPLLSREEEHELAKRWVETGDREAGRRLVTANLRLVVKLANEYRRGYQNLLDLVQEGNVGLLKAVDRFDPYRGIKLSTYAAWWIRAYILKYILANWRLVKLGTTQNQRKLFYNLNKQRRALEAAGVEPTSENLADALDVSTQEGLAAPDASLHAPVGDDDAGGRTKLDLLANTDDEFDPESTVEAAQFKTLLSEKLRRFGADLQGREAELFSERLMAETPVTLQSLGERWGVSRERARQVEKRMMLRLRTFLNDELGDAVQIALGNE